MWQTGRTQSQRITPAVTERTRTFTEKDGTPSVPKILPGNASVIRKNTVLKMFNTEWMEYALMRIVRSGWTVVILFLLALLLCSFHGRQSFLVWWLNLSGVGLIGFSIFIGNLPNQLIKPSRYINKYACFWSCVVWAVGLLLMTLSPVLAKPYHLIWFYLMGGLTGLLCCLWVSHKGLLKWIQ